MGLSWHRLSFGHPSWEGKVWEGLKILQALVGMCVRGRKGTEGVTSWGFLIKRVGGGFGCGALCLPTQDGGFGRGMLFLAEICLQRSQKCQIKGLHENMHLKK